MNKLLSPIIVIGGSAGSIGPLLQIIQGLPAAMPFTVFVVIHRPSGPSQLPKILSERAKPPVCEAEHRQPVESGTIYVAPSDYHLLLKPGYLELSQGEKVNQLRPAIDPLFESATQVYKTKVLGILLSGVRCDGCRGLLEIKKHGGIAIVQDPSEAMHPQNLRQAIRINAYDFILTCSRIASLLSQLNQ